MYEDIKLSKTIPVLKVLKDFFRMRILIIRSAVLIFHRQSTLALAHCERWDQSIVERQTEQVSRVLVFVDAAVEEDLEFCYY